LVCFQGSSFVFTDDAVKPLIDKQVLIIVKKIQRGDLLSDDVVEVIRITDDLDLIKQFHCSGNNFTPAKVLNYKILFLLCFGFIPICVKLTCFNFE
jgi:hypothetical protein